MALAQLTHLWMEQPLVPEARSLVPPHVTLLPAALGEPRPYANAAPAQAAIALSQLRYDADFLAAAPKLRILSRAGIGLDNVDVPAASRRGVAVCNAPDGPTESTAEHAVALMLALAKRLKPGDANVAAGNFGPRSGLLGTELKGRTLGLLGLGRIGRRVAEICGLGLKMNVVASDPAVKPEQAREMGVTLTDQESVIARADVLSLHAPLLPQTRGMMNRERLGRMKKGSYLINVARGALVVEEDLLAAIDAGHLAGAGLDVFEPEPPAKGSRIRNHPSIIVTPHAASVTAEGRARTDVMAVEAVLAFFRGEPAPNLVNPR